MTFDVRAVDPAEFTAWYDVMFTAFFSTTDAQEAADYRRPHIDPERIFGAFDGKRVVATLRGLERTLAVPGGAIVAADAVTNVTTLPTHRRRGALSQLMPLALNAAVGRGEPLSILIAARWPIYGRFGYGPAVERAEYRVDAESADFGEHGRRGTLEYVDRVTGREVAPAVFDRFQRSQPGAINRVPIDFDHDFAVSTLPGHDKWNGRTVVHRASPGGEVDGYLRYSVADKWDGMEPRSVLTIDDLIATTPDAYAALWRLCCAIDNVAQVSAPDRSVDEPLPWLLTDGRAIVQTSRSDFVWLRLLDVEAALSARHYLVEGAVVIEIHDTLGHAAGRYRLEGGPAAATCARTTDPADLETDVASLSSAYLGGVHLGSLAAVGRVVEHRAGALATADAMFRSSVSPWCNTWF
jgi:predicted acetyltransferase